MLSVLKLIIGVVLLLELDWLVLLECTLSHFTIGQEKVIVLGKFLSGRLLHDFIFELLFLRKIPTVGLHNRNADLLLGGLAVHLFGLFPEVAGVVVLGLIIFIALKYIINV
jgi:hypothetical protein